MAQQSVTEFIAFTVKNLLTPKAAAKRELLFNKPTLGAVFTTLFSLQLTDGPINLERLPLVILSGIV